MVSDTEDVRGEQWPRALLSCGSSAGRFSTYLDLFRLISSHITLFNLPAEHYSSYQPNNLIYLP
jgi:hypothetical protein